MPVGVNGKKHALSREDALHEKIRQCAPIIDAFPDIAYFKDMEHRNVFINRAFEKFAGRKKDAIIGKRDDEFLPKALATQCMKSDAAAMSGKPVRTEEIFKNKDGKTAFFDTMKFPLKDGDQIIGIMGISREITEKKRDEHELKESEASYKAIAGNIPGIVYRIHLKGEKNFTEFFNDNVTSLTGYPPEKLHVGECPMDPLIIGEDRKHAIETIEKAIKNGQPYKVEYRIKNKNGDIRHFVERGRPVLGSKLKAEHIDGVIFDVTQSKKADDAFRNVMDQYKYLYDESPAVNIIVGRDGKIRDINRKSAESIGYTREEMIGKSIFSMMTPSDIKKVLVVLKDSIMNKPTPELELDIKAKDGSVIKLLLSEGGTPIYDKGNAIGVLVTGMNITEHMKAESTLDKNQALLRDMAQMAKIGGWEFYVDTLNQKWTEETFRILEVDYDGVAPKVPKGVNFIVPEYRLMADKAIQRAIKFGEPYDQEWEVVTAKGNRKWVRAVAKVNRTNGKITSVSGSFQDITEQKKMFEKMKESEEQYRFLVDSMHEIAIILSKTGTIMFANRSSLETLGYSESEVIGKSITGFLTKGSLKKAFWAIGEEFLGNKQGDMEVNIKNKKGEIRTLIISSASNPVHKDGKVIGTLVNA
ncbi:MAG: PAS domain S-box protein, partial [Candidatus Aenigmatarchaeota archaeon]